MAEQYGEINKSDTPLHVGIKVLFYVTENTPINIFITH